MTKVRPNPARYGHVAALLRQIMQERSWEPQDINRAIGLKASYSGVYVWLRAAGAPGPKNMPRLRKAFPQVPVEAWMARDPARHGVPAAVPAVPSAVTAPAVFVAPPAEVMTVNITDDGRVRIRLDVTMPVADGLPLVRMLFDQGIRGETGGGGP